MFRFIDRILFSRLDRFLNEYEDVIFRIGLFLEIILYSLIIMYLVSKIIYG